MCQHSSWVKESPYHIDFQQIRLGDEICGVKPHWLKPKTLISRFEVIFRVFVWQLC